MKIVKMNTLKITRKAFALSLLAVATISGSAFILANADFSGEWKLNESKSNMGQFGRAAKTLKVQGDPGSIAIQRISTNQQGEEVSTSEKLTFDDKETESTVFGNSKRKAKAKYSEDGKTMTVKATTVFDRNGQTMEIKSTEVWTLSDDGKTLTIDNTTESPRGTNTSKLVYDKVAK